MLAWLCHCTKLKRYQSLILPKKTQIAAKHHIIGKRDKSDQKMTGRSHFVARRHEKGAIFPVLFSSRPEN